MKHLNSLEMKYTAEMLAALANIEVYMTNSVGIGEHPDITEAIESQIKRYNDAKEMLNSVIEVTEKVLNS